MKKIILTSLLLLFSISLVACSDKKIEDEIVVDDIDVEATEETDKVIVDFEKGTKEYFEFHIKKVIYEDAVKNRNGFYIYYRDLTEALDNLETNMDKVETAKDKFAEFEITPGELIPEFADYDEEDVYEYMVYAFNNVYNGYDLVDDLNSVFERKLRIIKQIDDYRQKLIENNNTRIQELVMRYKNDHPNEDEKHYYDYEKSIRESLERNIEEQVQRQREQLEKGMSKRSLNSDFIEGVQIAARYW